MEIGDFPEGKLVRLPTILSFRENEWLKVDWTFWRIVILGGKKTWRIHQVESHVSCEFTWLLRERGNECRAEDGRTLLTNEFQWISHSGSSKVVKAFERGKKNKCMSILFQISRSMFQLVCVHHLIISRICISILDFNINATGRI